MNFLWTVFKKSLIWNASADSLIVCLNGSLRAFAVSYVPRIVDLAILYEYSGIVRIHYWSIHTRVTTSMEVLSSNRYC